MKGLVCALLATVANCHLESATSVPSTMKAGAVVKQSLDMKLHLDYIQEVQVPTPRLNDGQILVHVQGSSVNPIDWHPIESNASRQWSYPHVLGRDFAGTVVAIGSGVANFNVGDRVWGDNPPRLGGEGSFGEYMAVDQSIVGLAPSKISLAEAGVLPEVSLTSLGAFYFTQHRIFFWTVVVLGGSGGCGHTGVQLAAALGADKIITTCGTSHVDFCKSLTTSPVPWVIDYHKEDYHKVVPARSVDIVYDAVGIKGTGDLAYDILKDDGYFVTLQSKALPSQATARKRPGIKYTFLDPTPVSKDLLDRLKDIVDAGKLRGHIDKSFSIAEVADAIKASASGHTGGKISVIPSNAKPEGQVAATAGNVMV